MSGERQPSAGERLQARVEAIGRKVVERERARREGQRSFDDVSEEEPDASD